MNLLEQIEATERRYAERTSARESVREYLVGESLLRINDPNLVRERISRLGIENVPADVTGRGFRATLAETADAGQNIAIERIINQNDLMPISFLTYGAVVARSIGRINVRSDEGNGFGTGFLVSPRLLLTNHHVLTKSADADTSFVEFNFERGGDGKPLAPVKFHFEPNTFFVTDPKLDFSIVAVREISEDGQSLSGFGALPLLASPGKVLLGEFVNIIQHPSGQLKQVALRANQVTDLLDDFLHYETDTAQGSSGSCVCNDQWEVVALHHSGVPRKDASGRILTKDGALFKQGMSDDDIDWIANEGVRISRIVTALEVLPLSAQAKKLVDQALTAPKQPPEVSRPGPRNGANTRRDPVPKPAPQPPRQGEDHVTKSRLDPSASTVRVAVPSDGSRLTVPFELEITVRMTGGVPRRPADSRVPATSASRERDEALAELRESAVRSYYDAASDKQAAVEYYEDIDTSASPAKLFRKLSGLLVETHTTQPAYKPAKELYPWIDLQPNRQIRSIYSQLEFDPEELIREDFRIDERRAELQERLLAETPLSQERFLELNLLEAMLPYNCEHTICQSWFDKQEPMRGDLHHLFTCEAGCNSFRGNQRYHQFAAAEEVFRNDCGRREQDLFEPNAGKGAVARATLYFLLRYPGVINSLHEEYDEDALKTLIEWHQASPIDAYERHRNAAIFERQGNRNPLIDHPEWVDRIRFRDGL